MFLYPPSSLDATVTLFVRELHVIVYPLSPIDSDIRLFAREHGIVSARPSPNAFQLIE